MAEAALSIDHRTCNAVGCGRFARSPGAALCEMHYYRGRRSDPSYAKPAPKRRRRPPRTIPHSHGYELLYSPGHPLTPDPRRARVYEHRAVYYEHHGDGPFLCHWCRETVTWRGMHVDHLDDDKANNEPANLVASCPTCNQGRASGRMKTAKRERLSAKITWDGLTLPLPEWAERIGITTTSLKARIRRWPLERAMTEPRGVFGPPCHSKHKQRLEQTAEMR